MWSCLFVVRAIQARVAASSARSAQHCACWEHDRKKPSCGSDDDIDEADEGRSANDKRPFSNPLLSIITNRHVRRDGNGCKKLANTLEECSSAGTTRRHNHWKRCVNLTQPLRGLAEPEVALLIVSQVKGKAKDSGHLGGKRLLANPGRSLCRLGRGQTAAWVERARVGSVLERTRLELEAQDEHVFISKKTSWRPKCSVVLRWQQKRNKCCSTLKECWILSALEQSFAFVSRRCARSRRGQDKRYHPTAFPREPLTQVKVCETEIESEQEQEATNDENVFEVDLSVDEDELVECFWWLCGMSSPSKLSVSTSTLKMSAVG